MTLIRLIDDLDGYHERRKAANGSLYLVVRRYNGVVEARSIATGRVCTFDVSFIEEASHGLQEPQGS